MTADSRMKMSRRRLLGVAGGIGVQNMHRTYQTIIPPRPEMLNIIRTAHERGSPSSTAPKPRARTSASAFWAKRSSPFATRW
ncbi:hypothetical protein J2X13_005693 [Aminobacter aminovorans]|nr:hypothetical protein [Aminobacter aminovorans]